MTSLPAAAPSGAPPRVCSVPAHRYTLGDDVADLAELAGLPLDGWQRDVLRAAMGERDDGRWSAFEVAVLVARQNGKNAILEARELAGLLVLGEGLILHSAHEYKTAMEAYRRILALLRRLGTRVSDNVIDVDGVPIKTINTNGEEGFERLDTGARLKFIARSKGAGRGFSADCLIWDEAYALTEDQVDAQMPTLSAMPNAQIWYTSSPPLDAMTGAQLFRVRRRGLAGDPALAYLDWGAEGCLDDLTGVDLDDRALWAATNPAYGIRISDEAIARERRAMSAEGFARERLGIWPPDVDQADPMLPSMEQWRALADAEAPGDPVAFAIEVSFNRSAAAIVAVGPHPDGRRRAIEVIEHWTGEWSNEQLVARVLQLNGEWRPVAWGLAIGGPAGALVQPLADAGIVAPTGEPERGQLWIPSSSLLGAACGALVDGVRQQTLAHRDDPRLNDALACARTRPMGDTWMFARKASGDICCLVAMTVGLAAYEARKHLATDYSLLDSVR